MIEITNNYIDTIGNSNLLQTITKKEFTAKTSYWLATIFNKLETLSKVYFEERKKLIEKYAIRDSKGDILTEGDSIKLKDVVSFNKELTALLEIKINLGISNISYDLDKEPKSTVDEMSILLPLIEVL